MPRDWKLMFSLKICLTSLLTILICFEASFCTLQLTTDSSVTFPNVQLTSCLKDSILVTLTFRMSLPSHKTKGKTSPQLTNLPLNASTMASLIQSVFNETNPPSIGASGLTKIRLRSHVIPLRGLSSRTLLHAILIVSILLMRIASFCSALAPNSIASNVSNFSSRSTKFFTSTQIGSRLPF